MGIQASQHATGTSFPVGDFVDVIGGKRADDGLVDVVRLDEYARMQVSDAELGDETGYTTVAKFVPDNTNWLSMAKAFRTS